MFGLPAHKVHLFREESETQQRNSTLQRSESAGEGFWLSLSAQSPVGEGGLRTAGQGLPNFPMGL